MPPSGVGHTSDDDARGLKPEYLRSEAEKSLFIGQVFMLLATHATFFAFWLAAGKHSYGAAIALSVPASILWRNAIRETRRSASLFIAANLNKNA